MSVVIFPRPFVANGRLHVAGHRLELLVASLQQSPQCMSLRSNSTISFTHLVVSAFTVEIVVVFRVLHFRLCGVVQGCGFVGWGDSD